MEHALLEPPGLLAAGGDLSPARLLAAYERGVFPWYSAQQPILWWSPDPRMVLFPQEFKCSRSLRKTLRNGPYTTRADHAFGATIRACAAPRRGGPDTWLNKDMIASYEQLHELGFSHSIETYEAGRLAGGLYGIQLGQVFFGESMFSLQRDASKVALARLVEECRARDIQLNASRDDTRDQFVLFEQRVVFERHQWRLVMPYASRRRQCLRVPQSAVAPRHGGSWF